MCAFRYCVYFDLRQCKQIDVFDGRAWKIEQNQ